MERAITLPPSSIGPTTQLSRNSAFPFAAVRVSLRRTDDSFLA